MTCDAAMAPVVTGEVNPAALEDLIRLCVQLHRLRDPGAGGTDAGAGGSDTSGEPRRGASGGRRGTRPTPRGRGRRWSRR